MKDPKLTDECLYLRQRDEQTAEVSRRVAADGILQRFTILQTTNTHHKPLLIKHVIGDIQQVCDHRLTCLIHLINLLNLSITTRGQNLYETGLIGSCSLKMPAKHYLQIQISVFNNLKKQLAKNVKRIKHLDWCPEWEKYVRHISHTLILSVLL